MADADDAEKQKDTEVEETEKSTEEKPEKKTSGGGILQWIIMAVVVTLCAAAGLGLARLFADSTTSEKTESSQQDQPTQPEGVKPEATDLSARDSQKAWYYDLKPVVANLDEPGVTRYVRAALTLEINHQVDESKGIDFLEQKNPLLTNWLTIYLASLSLEDIRGDRNLKRIQLEILNAFNERLFPDARPQIKKVLFREFAVQ